MSTLTATHTITLHDGSTLAVVCVETDWKVTDIHIESELSNALLGIDLRLPPGQTKPLAERLHLSSLAGYRFIPTEGGPITIKIDAEDDGDIIERELYDGIIRSFQPR